MTSVLINTEEWTLFILIRFLEMGNIGVIGPALPLHEPDWEKQALVQVAAAAAATSIAEEIVAQITSYNLFHVTEMNDEKWLYILNLSAVFRNPRALYSSCDAAANMILGHWNDSGQKLSSFVHAIYSWAELHSLQSGPSEKSTTWTNKATVVKTVQVNWN